MIVLDTNVLSELAKPSPAPAVLAWCNRQRRTDLFVTTITQAEILFGLGILPKSKRRTGLEEAARIVFDVDFDGSVLSFDSDAAREYARIAVARRKLGRPISTMDAQIAAITRSRQATLATRNTADFDHCGVPVLNPWLD